MRAMSTSLTRSTGFLSVAGLALGSVLALSQSGCPGGGSATDMGSSAPDLAFTSCCGKAGDPGNSKGVGQFCIEHGDCTKDAVLCSAAAAPQKRAYFCTAPCNPDLGTAACGENSVCQFDSAFQAHGCVPSACIANLPAGCSL